MTYKNTYNALKKRTFITHKFEILNTQFTF